MEFRDKPMENLMRLQEKDICKNVNALLLEGEQIVGAYKTVRDQVVFTSHRIIMVDMQCDKIIVLKKGKIIESGTHLELLDKRGHYYNLYQLQYEKKN